MPCVKPPAETRACFFPSPGEKDVAMEIGDCISPLSHSFDAFFFFFSSPPRRVFMMFFFFISEITGTRRDASEETQSSRAVTGRGAQPSPVTLERPCGLGGVPQPRPGCLGGLGGRSAHQRGIQLPPRACWGTEVAAGPGCPQPPPRCWGFAEQLEEPHKFTLYHSVSPRVDARLLSCCVSIHSPPSMPAACPACTEAHGDPAHSCSGWLGKKKNTRLVPLRSVQAGS